MKTTHTFILTARLNNDTDNDMNLKDFAPWYIQQLCHLRAHDKQSLVLRPCPLSNFGGVDIYTSTEWALDHQAVVKYPLSLASFPGPRARFTLTCREPGDEASPCACFTLEQCTESLGRGRGEVK